MNNKLKEVGEQLSGTRHRGRRRYSLQAELTLAILPTLTILIVLLLVETLACQRILFASLAASAFLIYRDPYNQMNSIYSLLVSQTGGATFGLLSYILLGEGYGAAALAMLSTIIFIISLDAIHPPAIGTAISFGFRAPNTNAFFLFLLALGMVAVLLLLEQIILWIVRRVERHDNPT